MTNMADKRYLEEPLFQLSDTEFRERVLIMFAWSDDNNPSAEGHATARVEAAKYKEKEGDSVNERTFIEGFEIAMCYVHDILNGFVAATAAPTAASTHETTG